MRPAVLFDLDGTLTDPKPGITRCIAHALRCMGRVAPDPDTLTWCIGPPLTHSLPTLLECEDKAEIARAIGHYRERFGDVGLFENTVYEGIPEMLATLRDYGVRLFVATSKPWTFAERILTHFGLRESFEAVYGSELDGTRADKGELIAYILATEGLSPANVLMVGDREHDVLGAKRCGVRCVGVRYGYCVGDELARAGAVAECERPAEVATTVLRLLPG
ncbi:MAG: HAD family hydrolase [Fimbriimonas sp.]